MIYIVYMSNVIIIIITIIIAMLYVSNSIILNFHESGRIAKTRNRNLAKISCYTVYTSIACEGLTWSSLLCKSNQ